MVAVAEGSWLWLGAEVHSIRRLGGEQSFKGGTYETPCAGILQIQGELS